jgi:hypothetical protein
MTHPLRACAVSLALLLAGAPAFAASLTPSDTSALLTPPDTSGLRFHGFRAGASLAELDSIVRRLAGGLRCDRSKRDPRVSECRGVVRDSAMGGRVEVWVSAMDGLAGVISLSAGLDTVGLARWRRTLEQAYGSVGTKVQGHQRMMQWVRRGRMLRLTWRAQGGEHQTSVSLVDGRVLDAWAAEPTGASP